LTHIKVSTALVEPLRPQVLQSTLQTNRRVVLVIQVKAAARPATLSYTATHRGHLGLRQPVRDQPLVAQLQLKPVLSPLMPSFLTLRSFQMDQPLSDQSRLPPPLPSSRTLRFSLMDQPSRDRSLLPPLLPSALILQSCRAARP